MSDSPSSGGAHRVEVGPEQAGQRLDNFLLRTLKGVPRSHVYQLVRSGQVRVNRGRVQAGYRLRAGDSVRIPPVHFEERIVVQPGKAVLQRLSEMILFEDDVLLVLDKASGLAVHGGSGLSYGVIEGLRALRPDARFLELVHRLDRETSGLLLIAKRRSALRSLHEQLREGVVRKHYVALLHGRWPRKSCVVDAPLRKNQVQSGERIVRISPDGKAARTRFAPIERHGDTSLVHAEPITGRTHQIRVHAAHAGHAIAGDEKYGSRDQLQAMREQGLRRLFLHAERLAFTHPRTGKAVEFHAPLPAELAVMLGR